MHFFSPMDTKYGEQIATKIFFYFTCDKKMYILLIENVIVIVYVYIYEAPCNPG